MKKEIVIGSLGGSNLPFSLGVRRGNFVSISGQGAQDRASGEFLYVGDVERQTHHVLENIGLIAEAAGGTFEDIVSLRVYLTHRDSLSSMNSAYGDYVSAHCASGILPTRTTIIASLPHPSMLVEIDALMVLDEESSRVG